MRPAIQTTRLTDTLTMSEAHDGFWLYDKTRGTSLSMRAKTPTDAFVEALTYYQCRLAEVETAHRNLRGLVDAFVSNFVQEDEE